MADEQVQPSVEESSEALPVERVTVSASASSEDPKPSLITEIPDDSEPNKKKKKGFSFSSLSYMTRVTMAFALIAGMTLLVAVGILSYVWNQHFYTYARQNAQSISDATADRIAQTYDSNGGVWTVEMLLPASYVADSYPGAAVVVTDAQGVVMYDSTRSDNLSEAVSSNVIGVAADNANDAESPTESSQVSLIPSSSTVVVYSHITSKNAIVGTVRIWTTGSDPFLRDSDEVFRDNSYQAMALASVIAIALAAFFGFWFARSLVRPINRMASTAKEIASGNLSARTDLHGEDEIAHLGETFDAMAESIEKDRQLERRLTTDVAHELRTPLMAIQATVEAMVDGVFKPTPERLSKVNSEVQRLGRLVEALLRLSRLENRSTPMKEEVINVGDLISSIISTHEALVNDAGLELHYEVQKNVLIKGDADMIRQATANLISNAVRYTPEGGSITVRVKKGELMANIIVEDTGIGLSPDEAKMVFSRFWRADAGRNRETGGLGIGLAVVKEIIDRHGGWCQAEGKKGEGSRFTLHIPLYDDASEKAKAKKKQKQKGNSLSLANRGKK